MMILVTKNHHYNLVMMIFGFVASYLTCVDDDFGFDGPSITRVSIDFVFVNSLLICADCYLWAN